MIAKKGISPQRMQRDEEGSDRRGHGRKELTAEDTEGRKFTAEDAEVRGGRNQEEKIMTIARMLNFVHSATATLLSPRASGPAAAKTLLHPLRSPAPSAVKTPGYAPQRAQRNAEGSDHGSHGRKEFHRRGWRGTLRVRTAEGTERRVFNAEDAEVRRGRNQEKKFMKRAGNLSLFPSAIARLLSPRASAPAALNALLPPLRSPSLSPPFSLFHHI